jgi:xanthine dehydrogenase accessory factor
VGLLASRRRAQAVFDALAQRGLSAARLTRVHAPVGLDIGARSPGDVAIAIIAEIVATLRSDEVTKIAQPPIALDPVCGMEVELDSARQTLEHEGRRYVFCSAGCRARFAAQLERPVPTTAP